MSADDRERDQRLGVYVVWGALAITFVGMLPLLIGVQGGPIPVLLLAALVVVLGKVSADALADGSRPDAPEEGFRVAGDPVGARGDDAASSAEASRSGASAAGGTGGSASEAGDTRDGEPADDSTDA